MRNQTPADILIGTAADRAGEQLTAAVGTMFFLEVAPFTLSVFDGAGGRADYTPGAGALVAPLGEVIEGTGVGVSSSPKFKFTVATALLEARDSAGNSFFEAAGLLANRTVRIFDTAGNVLAVFDAKAATRTTSLVDEAGQPMLDVSQLAAVRTIVISDAAGAPLASIDTTVAARTVEVVDAAGVTILGVSATPGARSIAVIDDAGNPMQFVNTLAASRITTVTDPVGKPITTVTGTAARLFEFQDEVSADVVALDLVAATAKMTLGQAGSPQLIYNKVANSLSAFNAAAVLTWLLNLVTGVTSQPATSPAAMAAVENDYALAVTAFARLTPNAANTALTGIVKEPDGARKVLVNIAAPTLTVQNQNAGSAAANRIITKTGADVVLALNGSMDLCYDNATARWREV